MPPDFWNALTAISTAVSTLVILITGLLIFWQLLELRRSSNAAAFANVVTYLQEPTTREARKTLILISKQDMNDWTNEEKRAAEIVCNTYDVVGIMVANRFIPGMTVVREWRDSIIKCWTNAKPLIDAYRKERREDYWDGFERLYELACRL